MMDIKYELQQIKEQTEIVLSTVQVFGYAVGFLIHMSQITDERELGIMGNHILNGMECLSDYQRKIINHVDELVRRVGEDTKMQ